MEKGKGRAKKSEGRFRSYFDLPLHGIAITSSEKGWIQVNDRICSILGYSIDDLIVRADKLMYEQKQNKKSLLR